MFVHGANGLLAVLEFVFLINILAVQSNKALLDYMGVFAGLLRFA